MPLVSAFGCGEAGSGLRVPPPKHFIPECVESARFLLPDERKPHEGKRSRRTPSQKAGLAYQRRVEKLFSESFGAWDLRLGPWLVYSDATPGLRYCQPDILLWHGDSRTAIIVETKIRWTTDAWWQLRRLYQPVVEAALQPERTYVLCVCRGYDPAVRIEEQVWLVDHLGAPMTAAFNVLVLR